MTETAALQCFLTPSQRTVQCSFCTANLFIIYVYTLRPTLLLLIMSMGHTVYVGTMSGQGVHSAFEQ